MQIIEKYEIAIIHTFGKKRMLEIAKSETKEEIIAKIIQWLEEENDVCQS